ncbi:MAG: DUF6526 family protein [Acidobacteriota bacterium]
MADKTPQSFASHAKYVPAYHFVMLPILLVHLLWKLWGLVTGFGIGAAVDAAVAFALMIMAVLVRTSPLTAQDRVIRLEETLRMQSLLPEDLVARIGELRRGHFVALRFASDDELPELVRRVLDGELKGGKDIKQAIRTWRPDHLRV